MNHEAEIIQVLTPYLMAFPQSKMNEGSLLVYARALRGLSIAEIDAAMLKLMRKVKFFPTVAEIFEQAENVKSFAAGTENKTADEAWKEVLQEVHDAFVYRKPRFSSKQIEKAALSMGWTALCELPVDGMNTARAQFMRIYQSVLDRQKDKNTNIEVIKSLSPNRVNELIGKATPKLSLVSGA